MKLSELKSLAGIKGDSTGRPRLIGVYRKEHDRVYVWQLSAGGYAYEIEYTDTGKKITSDKPFNDIDAELHSAGYKSIIENKEDTGEPPIWPPHVPF